ncbi:hypothetical protein [Rosistilla oblonga]|uniref:Uncharacterized protein n=1 Tax=Rosistilla oblonga TaxID=2527990 RepID=A0A518ITJ5_9BACT|nr:hypothetical protein [Rosistilla oblonga]QDV56407.1 hypothetical protein Mal33_23970 [Rosistilla oblonga]
MKAYQVRICAILNALDGCRWALTADDLCFMLRMENHEYDQSTIRADLHFLKEIDTVTAEDAVRQDGRTVKKWRRKKF